MALNPGDAARSFTYLSLPFRDQLTDSGNQLGGDFHNRLGFVFSRSFAIGNRLFVGLLFIVSEDSTNTASSQPEGKVLCGVMIPNSAVERWRSRVSDQKPSQDEKMTRSQGREGVMPAEAGIQAFRTSWIPA